MYRIRISFKCLYSYFILTEILTEEQKKEELEKLYSAIGYSEGEVITAFPKEVPFFFFFFNIQQSVNVNFMRKFVI